MTTTTLDPGTFVDFREYIRREAGIALSDEKQYLLESRLGGMAAELGCADLAELLARARNDGSGRLRDRIVDAMTTNETLWFRDRAPFDVLRDVLLPRYADEIRHGRRDRVRIWSSACSTGQEPYSVMITVLEYIRTQTALKEEHIEILATDISRTALAQARTGLYNGVEISRGLPPELLSRYFVEEGRHWVVKPELKRRIEFRTFNLMDSFSLLGSFDVVLNRYVSIYFQDAVKRLLYGKIRHALGRDGVLFLGSSETIDGYSTEFATERHGRAVFYRAGDADAAGSLAADLRALRSDPAPAAPAAPASDAAERPAPTNEEWQKIIEELRRMNARFES